MRCSICDANSMGLSMFRSEGYHKTHFTAMPNGDLLCDDCYSADSEMMSDYYDQDLENEENDDAFDYD